MPRGLPRGSLLHQMNMSPGKEKEMIYSIRDWLKRELWLDKYLPRFPDEVAERMFLGRIEPWTYRYWDSKILHYKKSCRVEFVVQALLKKQYRDYLQKHRFRFFASCLYAVETNRVKFTEIRSIAEGADT